MIAVGHAGCFNACSAKRCGSLTRRPRIASIRSWGGRWLAARQPFVDGHPDVLEYARLRAAKAILVPVPKDLGVCLADRRRACRNGFENRLDDHVARHGLLQRHGIQADALEVGVILVIVAIADADFHQAAFDRRFRQHDGRGLRCRQNQGFDPLLSAGDAVHPSPFVGRQRIRWYSEQACSQFQREVDPAWIIHRASPILPVRVPVPAAAPRQAIEMGVREDALGTRLF